MSKWKAAWKTDRSPWVWLILTLLLGLLFRVAHLDQKVYWVDEVATSFRIAGYTRTEVIQHLATGQLLSIDQLQYFQQLSPQRQFSDTLHALQLSPEHAPLYFLLARLWAQLLGTSVTALRSLSVLFSLLALPCCYWLAWELFHSRLQAALALALLSVSPFFVAYAQEARPYSLWSVTLLLSGASLLRSLRLQDAKSWGLYSLSLVLGLYTSLLSLLVFLGQGCYVLGCYGLRMAGKRPRPWLRSYALSVGWALLLFIPWLIVIGQHWQNLQDNTTWMRVPMQVLPMLAIWLYSLTVLFFDFPVAANWVITGAEMTAAIVVLCLMIFALYFLCRTTARRIWLFVLSFAVTTPGVLILLDFALKGQTSTAPRYIMPCHLGVLLAIAFLLTEKLSSLKSGQHYHQQWFWRWLTCILISVSLISCTFQLEQPSKYQKSRNLHNPPIATLLNAATHPVVLSEPENTIDLLSLSYLLEANVKIQIAPPAFLGSQLNQPSPSYHCQNLFLFNPSESFQAQLWAEKSLVLTEVYQPERLIPSELALSLWSIQSSDNRCVHLN